MKKFLLLAAMAAITAPAFAVTDGDTYDAKGGYTFENLWVNANGAGAWVQLATDGVIPSRDFVASAVPMGDKIYVASSKSWVTGDDGVLALADQGMLLVFDYATGEYIKSIDLTIDGQPLKGTLCANYLDRDDFGHMFIYSVVFTPLSEDGTATGMAIYTVDPETGALTKQVAPEIDEPDKSQRCDFIAVSGDVTREQAPLTVMNAPGQSVPMYVYAWNWEQGAAADDYYGNFAGGYICTELEECFPEGGTFGQCAKVTIVPDEEYSGATYYIDGNATYPALYDTEGAMISSFADVVEEDKDNLQFYPVAAPCGAYEFTIGNDTFLCYGAEEHSKEERNRARLCRYGIAGDFSTLEKFYDFPKGAALNDGLGAAYGGRRLHCIHTNIISDENGKLAAEILTYKTGNGMGLYRLAQEGFNAGLTAPVVDSNASVEYFNLQGIRVDNPENGIFIRRQGTEVSKVIL